MHRHSSPAARSLLFAEDPPWPQNWDSHNRTTLNFGFIVAQNTPLTMKTLKVGAEPQGQLTSCSSAAQPVSCVTRAGVFDIARICAADSARQPVTLTPFAVA